MLKCRLDSSSKANSNETNLHALGDVIGHAFLLPFMNCFNKTEAAVLPCRLCFLGLSLFSVYNYAYNYNVHRRDVLFENNTILLVV